MHSGIQIGNKTVAIPPGESLKEILRDRNIKQKDFAKEISISEKHLSHIIQGKVALSANVARKLQDALGIPLSFWMSLEGKYQEDLIRVQEEKKQIKEYELKTSRKFIKRAKDIANFFIQSAIDSPTSDLMTNLKLNKLLYFAQGEYLAKYHAPLFEDVIEAWEYGAVVPSIYRKYQSHKRNPISVVDGNYSDDMFTNEEMDLLADVVVVYGRYSASELVNLTHIRGCPWDNVYEKNKNNIIDIDSMYSYFIIHSKIKKI